MVKLHWKLAGCIRLLLSVPPLAAPQHGQTVASDNCMTISCPKDGARGLHSAPCHSERCAAIIAEPAQSIALFCTSDAQVLASFLQSPHTCRMSSTIATLFFCILTAASAAACAAAASSGVASGSRFGATNTNASTPSAYDCVTACVQAACSCSTAAELSSERVPHSDHLRVRAQDMAACTCWEFPSWLASKNIYTWVCAPTVERACWQPSGCIA